MIPWKFNLDQNWRQRFQVLEEQINQSRLKGQRAQTLKDSMQLRLRLGLGKLTILDENQRLEELLHGVSDRPLRTAEISVKNLDGVTQDTDFPSADQLPEQLLLLQEWFERWEGENIFVAAWGYHTLFLAIHPFNDGNGRWARGLEHQILASRLGDKIPHGEWIAHWHFDEYVAALLQSRKEGHLDPFFEFQHSKYAEFFRRPPKRYAQTLTAP